jgi:hypothetical protein
MMEDDLIRALVGRLARPHSSGGVVIERAAILASGADSAAVLSWIATHKGEPEAEREALAAPGGLYGGRLSGNRSARPSARPSRYILPPGSLS